MLDKPADEIVYENGKVVGVKSQDEVSCTHVQYLVYMISSIGSLIGSLTSCHLD